MHTYNFSVHQQSTQFTREGLAYEWELFVLFGHFAVTDRGINTTDGKREKKKRISIDINNTVACRAVQRPIRRLLSTNYKEPRERLERLVLVSLQYRVHACVRAYE